ncbi:MMPL family transporter [soil metagenome]
MARLLFRLARYSAEHKWRVIAFWLALMVAFTVVLSTGTKTAEGDLEISGSDSANAQKVLERAFPSDENVNDEDLSFVFQVANGSVHDAEASAAIASAISAASQVEHVIDVSNPLDEGAISPDGTTAVATITFENLNDDAKVLEAAEEAIGAIAEQSGNDQLDVIVGGKLVEDEGPSLLGPTELAGAAIAFLVLIITFGSLRTAGANMFVALFGVILGLFGVMAYSAFTPIEDSTPILAAMLGLAVGIDYSLFILSRFRDELRNGRPVDEAIPMAVGTAGSAVIFAGATVIIALVGLAVVQIPFITEMGLGAAFSVAMAVLLSLTLLPVLMKFLGYRALPRKERAVAAGLRPRVVVEEQIGRLSVSERWASRITRRPKVALVVGVGALLTIAIPYLSMDTALNVPGGTDPKSAERRAYNLVAEKFGDGYQSPLIVLVESDNSGSDAATIAGEVSGFTNVASVSPAQESADGSAAIIRVTPSEGPNEQSTKDLVHHIRDASYSVDGARVAVTGSTAVDIDVDESLASALIVYIALIVVLAMLLLIVLFRSILVPVIASLGFLLSLGGGFGVMIALFQWGWFGSLTGVKEGQPILSLLPIIIVGILFGLAMDYQVFLVSRIHEAHVRGLSPQEAIRFGFSRASSIVAAAAVIMAAVFFGFGLSGSTLIASLAIALASGVLFDAFIVRMLITPAALMLLGHHAWWVPRWLDRIMPHIDTEGRTLETAHIETPVDAQPVYAGSPH